MCVCACVCVCVCVCACVVCAHVHTLPLYTHLQASLLGTFVDVPVTEALELCTKSVLKPFNVFLKTVSYGYKVQGS